MLHLRTAKVLQALSDLPSLRFEAVLEGDEIAKQGEHWKRKGNTAGIPVCVLIHGNKSMAQAVGRRLSKARIYLQHPNHLESHIEYDNPHYLKLPGRPSKNPVPPSIPIIQAKTLNLQGLEITDILENLGQDQGLQSVNGNWRIRTELLEYAPT